MYMLYGRVAGKAENGFVAFYALCDFYHVYLRPKLQQSQPIYENFFQPKHRFVNCLQIQQFHFLYYAEEKNMPFDGIYVILTLYENLSEPGGYANEKTHRLSG